MKIEFIEEPEPLSAWDRAMSGRLESSELIMRNLRKVSSDESSPLEKSAECVLNAYNRIQELKYEPASQSLADLVLDACGLVYVMIHRDKQGVFPNERMKRSRNDQIATDVGRITLDVEALVLKTMLGHVSLKKGDVVVTYQQEIEKCLGRYRDGGISESSGTTIRETVVKVVAKKLMDYEDMERTKGISEETMSLSLPDKERKSRIQGESIAIQHGDVGTKKGGINPKEYETHSSETRSSESDFDDNSSEFEESESNQESGVDITPRKGKGKAYSKKKNSHARNNIFPDELMEIRIVSSPGDGRRNNNRAHTLSDRHRKPEEWRSFDESDGELGPSISNQSKTFQLGHYRRSTTPIPHHLASVLEHHPASTSQRLGDAPYDYGFSRPSFGQSLANGITSHVMSTIRDSTRMHTAGDDEFESEYFYLQIYLLS
ncbi:hypothetical protein BYT27DRAFT_7238065 [Phlegmacium glaucopus]|nr:hypothetical protein BYT27DRAFT_7238065 [Phlegmacium glaucopus]